MSWLLRHRSFRSYASRRATLLRTGFWPLLTPDQAAELLSVKTSWIYEATRTGRLPCIRLGRHIRFTRAMLEEWLAGG